MNIDDAVKKVSEDIGVEFKDKQLEAIKCFCAGQDVFMSLPTGYGKSLIYAVLPLIFDRIEGKCLINVHHIHQTYHRSEREYCCAHKPTDSSNGFFPVRI